MLIPDDRAQGCTDQSARLVVRDALSQLCSEHRAVICRSFCGWTTHEIAADLHLTDAAVKAQLNDAIRALRSALPRSLP